AYLNVSFLSPSAYAANTSLAPSIGSAVAACNAFWTLTATTVVIVSISSFNPANFGLSGSFVVSTLPASSANRATNAKPYPSKRSRLRFKSATFRLGIKTLVSLKTTFWNHAGHGSAVHGSDSPSYTTASASLKNSSRLLLTRKLHNVCWLSCPHGVERHSLRHRCRMLVSQMAICLCCQDTTVLVPEPSSDRFEIHASLDCVRTKKMSQRMMSEPWQPSSSTR